MNVFIVPGRLTKDAVLRFTSDGTPVLGFDVANDVGYGEKKHTLYVRCSLWGKRAESLDPYMKKGTAVTVSGEADLKEWSSGDKSGTNLELRVSDVALQGGKPEQTQKKTSGFRNKPADNDGFDDDVDF
jgi:single-strand DNA-binding protein